MTVGNGSICHSRSDPVEAIERLLDHSILRSCLYSSIKGAAGSGKASGRGQLGRFARGVPSR